MGAADFMLGTLGSEVKMSTNDAQMNRSLENIVKETRLAGGSLVRYKQAQMSHWQWVYSWIPGLTRHVYDGGMGRNDLFALLQADSEMSYLVPADNALQAAYTVRFTKDSWREHLVFKSGDYWAYTLSFELVQTK